jgi:hypothetical protein
MSEEKLNKAAAKGMRAQRLLDDPIFQEAFDQIEAAYIEKWKSSSARDDDARQRLWQGVQILGIVKENIKQFAKDGRVAAASLKALTKG